MEAADRKIAEAWLAYLAANREWLAASDGDHLHPDGCSCNWCQVKGHLR